ncbi:polysaccharide deacetylase family protein [Ulvibacterium marinum]|uniref:Polysaccharide deacetylase family protein n=1 Tax=Ulvibacterium marinum TaxID=2419782 RepID=A0A3B0C9R6_9FLAO|nr:polysaccharide deacetylase family protein [Ulvibacterium marinum]RKN82403.1 polysaccharide deacetylase family protein [Ulvibacterium marinum]
MLTFVSIKRFFLIALIVLLVGDWMYNTPAFYYWILISIFLILTVLGSFLIQWNFHLKSHCSNPDIDQSHIALTFDDGPHHEYTFQVLQLLKQFNAKATFFCIGKHMEQHSDLIKQIIDEGHTIGNHTYSHSRRFGFFGTRKVISELQKTNNIFAKITGKQIQMYRPAFGVTNPSIKKAVQATELQSIGWSIRSLDTTLLSEDAILHRTTPKLAKGDIVLFHDTSPKTIIVLEQLLLILQEKNLQSVTVDQLLNIKAYA